MTSLALRAAVIACVLIVVAACTLPIRKVDSHDYGEGPSTGASMDQIKTTVESVATIRGWKLSNVQAGQFTGTRAWGGADSNKHNIVVDVVYNADTFSILYKDSKAMTYNGSSIHHTYNDMVLELQEGIQEAVSGL